MRVSFHIFSSSNELEKLFDFIVIDPDLIKADWQVREDIKYELGIGYKDTLAGIFKMDDISQDIAISKVQLPSTTTNFQPRQDPW